MGRPAKGSKTEGKGRTKLGRRVRSLRRREGLTQAALADQLGISASYLNLIENDRRPLTAALLIELAQRFDLDLSRFGADEDARLISALMEAFGDPALEEVEDLTNNDVRDLVASSPHVARAILRLYEELRAARESAQVLASRVADEDLATGVGKQLLPSEEVHDLLQRRGNHFPELEAAAEALWRDADLSEPNIGGALDSWLEERHGVHIERARGAVLRRFDPATRTLTLSDLLPPRSRNFQLAHQAALIGHRPLLEELAADAGLTTDDSRALARVALANYFAGAVLMPYAAFREAALDVRYDVELLGHRFRTSFEQVCHRLTTLSRPGAEGVPFHLLRVDVAGNISKRYSGSGIRFARYSGACPRWNVFNAFSMPGRIHTQVSVMPEGATFFCIARTVTTTTAGFRSPQAMYSVGLGCDVSHGPELVYADGMDLGSCAVPVGVTCRLCERLDCAQRALPPLQAKLNVDENLRGLSFYAPADAADRP